MAILMRATAAALNHPLFELSRKGEADDRDARSVSNATDAFLRLHRRRRGAAIFRTAGHVLLLASSKHRPDP
jgi:hypothetical protein